MNKQAVMEAIDDLLSTIHNEQESFRKTTTREELVEVRKTIRSRLNELHRQLIELFECLEKLEQEYPNP